MQNPNGAVRATARAALIGLLAVAAGCASVGPVDPVPGPSASGTAAPATAKSAPEAPVRSPVTVVPVAPQAALPPATPTPAPSVAPPPAAASPAVVVAPLRPVDAHRDLWGRVRAGFALPDMPTPLVAEKERFYMQRPEALQRMFARGGRYLHFIIEEVEKRGMPTEIALLPFVESAMNPVALSSAQAAGLWQFIPSTGKQYELSQNWWVDNRRDVVRSTRAALDYLQKIYEMHDRDWFLALASYNWGENAVARAVKNNRARGLPTDYLSLSMPAETRNYVPKLIALKQIVLNADAYGVALPEIPNRPYFATIEKTHPIDLKLAAQFSGLSVEDFVALNPAHNRPVIAASRNNEIKIPSDRVDQFVKAMERHDRDNKPMASWQPYTLKPGETLDEVARRGNVTQAELLRANGLSASRKLLPGTQVIAPQASVKDEMQVESFAGPRVYEQVSVPPVYHRVGKRESMSSIAASYGVSTEQLRAWNGGVKSVKSGSSLLVRQAGTQTVLTTAEGSRQVVARAAAPAPVARVEEPVVAAAAGATAAVAGKSAPVPSKAAPKGATTTRTAQAKGKATAPVAKVPAARKPAPVAKASAAPTPAVKAVYPPPRTKAAAAKADPR
ncbi:MAG: transglycosylase SLT domain-containing protein, partial [Burkholderiaceae bacterium]